MKTADLVTAGEVRQWRRRAAGVAAVAFFAVLTWAAGRFPVAWFAPWLGVAVAVLICVWFPLACRNWRRVDQVQWKTLGEGLPEFVSARQWQAPRNGVLVGVTTRRLGVDVDEFPFVVWNQSLAPHVLMCGPSGTGKTAATRWMALSLIQAGHDVGFIDGKSGGSYACFAAREHVLGVADEPGEWTDLAVLVRDEMRSRFTALRAWRYGQTVEKPKMRPVALVVDELVDVARIAGNEFLAPLEEITRMGREGGGRLFCSVLRPDIGQSVSGLVRDSLSGRIFLGRPSLTSAQMVFEDDMKAARAAAEGADGVRGRGVARFGGSIYPVQLPFVADPAEDQAVEKLFPPFVASRDELAKAREPMSAMTERARELRATGASYRDITGMLAAEGHKHVSPSTVRRMLG